MAQAQLAVGALHGAGAQAELVVIETAGDLRVPDTPWGEGAFVGAIEAALLAGEIDVAVHSAKDMPTDEDSRLRIISYLPRADPRDALVLAAGRSATTFDDLPSGTVIGTDSPRRTGFLRARRPDVVVRPLHGNVDTRLRRLDEGVVDGLVLACAGLDRIKRQDRISQRFDAAQLPPAPGQGAIALQARAEDEHLLELGARVDHRQTRLAVETERAFLAATGGGCRAPIGALATVEDGELTLLGAFATVDGAQHLVEQERGALQDAAIMADRLAERLVTRRATAGPHGRVLVTRPERQSVRLSARLAEQGLSAVVVPTIAIHLIADGHALVEEMHCLADYRWAVVTSANGSRAAAGAAARAGIDLTGGRWAAIGRQSAAELGAVADAAWLPSRPRAETLADELPLSRGDAVLLIRGSLADDELPARLRERGAKVREVVAYQTVEAPPSSRALLANALAAGPLAAVVFASPSAVRGLLVLSPADDQVALRSLPAICVGPVTAAAAREAGFDRVAESATADAGALAEAVADVLAGPIGAPIEVQR
jgi:hydroxymethylbilane synthase